MELFTRLKQQKFARTFVVFLLGLFAFANTQAQTIITDPPMLTDDVSVVIYFDAIGTELEDFTGSVYAHTGVTIDEVGDWQNVIGNWGDDPSQPQLVRDANNANLYTLELNPDIRSYYGVAEDLVITEICLVIRGQDGSNVQTRPDFFIPVFQDELNVAVINPPKGSPILESDASIDVTVISLNSESLSLYFDDALLGSTTDTEIVYPLDVSEYEAGTYWVIGKAESGNEVAYDSTYVYIRTQAPPVAELPDGLIAGINYLDDNTVTLVLHDPPALKEYVFVVGDFNDWMIDESGYMNVTPAGDYFWLTIEGLSADTEYGFQYFIDNEIRIPDPYTHKVLDPWNDHWIDDFNYPDLKPYPVGKTNGLVSVMHPGRPEFQWEVTNFIPPAPEDMVIYELLIRDFVDTSAINTVLDSLDYLQNLGVNVIELLPINQFEGNISWGYNPALYFATDKAYGTREDYKRFIDECHKRGIAVVLDIVLNHSFNLSPMAQMYFDPNAGNWGQPSPDNPWFLETCPHEPWCWGNTFDQDNPDVHEFFNRVTEYWLTEFKVDGFRFDFTKGFTNVQTGNQGSSYDAPRVANLKRIADHVWDVNPHAYVILEHFAENSEEKELADYGMMLWGNVTWSFRNAARGETSDSNFQWADYQQRGWNEPLLIPYLESHDEERVVFDNLTNGRSVTGYNIRDLDIALQRAELVAALYFALPGPKMIWQFGELGYDYSINHCQDGSIDYGCRTDPKPIRWDYYEQWRRKKVYDVYSALARLKVNEDVFRTRDYSFDFSGTLKKISLNHSSNKVLVIGNFGLHAAQTIPGFSETGKWYEFFSGDTLDVESLDKSIILRAGEYKLFSTVAFEGHGEALNTPFVEPIHASAKVYPNPSSNGFHFSTNQYPGKLNIRIINANGQIVFEDFDVLGGSKTEYFWDAHSTDRRKLEEGMYFYNIYSPGQSFNGKIMIK